MRRGRLVRALPAPPVTAGAFDAVPLDAAPSGAAAVAERITSASTEGRRLAQSAGDVVELARLLAERLVGDALAASDAALAHYASALIDEARGARALVLYARPEDALRLEAALRGHDFDERDVRVALDPSLAPGSLRIECELGSVEATIEESLQRLAERARSALADSELIAKTPGARLTPR